MNERTVNSTDTTEKSNDFFDYLGLKELNIFLEKIHQYAKEHFEKFTTLCIAIVTIGIWIIRALGYTYQSAKLSRYHIDKSYISLNDNFFLQIIEFIAAGFLFMLINYIYFYIATKEDNTKFHLIRKCRIIFLFVFEMVIISIIIIQQMDCDISNIIKEFQSYTFLTWIILIIMLFLAVCAFNALGISIIHLTRKEKKCNKENANGTKTNPIASNRLYSFVMPILIYLSLLFLISYAFGWILESQRTSFKVIQEQTEENLADNTIFRLTDNNSHFLYAVVYENEDVYILCPLYISDSKVSININCQKIISKDNVMTYNVDDISQITYIE